MFKLLSGIARLPFLTLTVLCIALTMSGVWYQHGNLSIALSGLVLLMALAAHVSVNAFNEYFDYRSGLDFLTERTPFSGGSGTLVSAPQHANVALLLAIVSLMLVIGIGLWFCVQFGWHLLLLGVPGVVLIYTYTQYVNKYPLMCLLAPGLGFGGIMTLGAYWVLAGSLDMLAVVLASLMALLTSNLLLLNQFPDVEADQQVGRRHLPIVLGRAACAKIYRLLLIACYALLLIATGMSWLPWLALLGMMTIPLAWILARDVACHAENIGLLIPSLGRNVLLVHALPALVIIGLLVAAA